MEEKFKPKFKVGDRIYPKYHKPSNDIEIIQVGVRDGNCCYRIRNHQTNGTYIMWEYEVCDYNLVEEEIYPTKGITTIDKAAEVFAEMLVELCPELLGFGGAAKEWENEFRKRLKE